MVHQIYLQLYAKDHLVLKENKYQFHQYFHYDDIEVLKGYNQGDNLE